MVMRHLLKLSAVLGLLFLAAPANAQISFGIQFGTPPPPPRAYRVAPMPGPDYVWVEGYWYPQGNRYRWHDGYWTRPPQPGSYWVAPYWQGGRYYEGYWGTPRGDFRHDHRWDKDRRRDERREDHDDHRR
jgi:hypothetical protein